MEHIDLLHHFPIDGKIGGNERAARHILELEELYFMAVRNGVVHTITQNVLLYDVIT